MQAKPDVAKLRRDRGREGDLDVPSRILRAGARWMPSNDRGKGLAWSRAQRRGRPVPLDRACYVLITPSRSNTRLISSKTAAICPLGNLIWESPTTFENSEHPSSNNIMAFLGPSLP